MPKRIIKTIHHLMVPQESNGYKPHSIRHSSLLIYSGFLIAVKIIILFLAFSLYPTHAEFSIITTNRIIELSNKVRLEQGLKELQISETLNQAATLKAQDMFQNNYFAHTSPKNIKPWHWFNEVGYNYTYAGENLAMNFIEAEDAISAWLNSETHKDNIISKNYDEIGVAVALGKINSNETTLVVQLFGKRYVNIKGADFVQGAREILVPTGTLKSNVKITEQAGQKEVVLKESRDEWMAKLIRYSSKLFLAILIFVLINLFLTIFIRFEIQHKPIIFHAILVIILAGIMILWKVHFLEGLGEMLIV